MFEQTELDLPPVPGSARATATPTIAASGAATGFGGFTWGQILSGAVILLTLIWAMWVTRAVVMPHHDNIVAARLSSLIGEYVEAQRSSGSPPEQVRAEMGAFMAALDREVQRRSARGEVVLVGEAVLTSNVPDITDSLRRSVYGSGIALPRRASVEQLQRFQQHAAVAQPAERPRSVLDQTNAGVATIDPLALAQALPAGSSAQPAASVDTFGGRDGDVGR